MSCSTIRPERSAQADHALGEREEHDLFPGRGADVVMQAHHLNARLVFDHGLHHRPRRFEQMRPNILEQVSALCRGERFDKLLLRGGQHTLQSDQQQIVDQMSMNLLRGPDKTFILENAVVARDAKADHGRGQCVPSTLNDFQPVITHAHSS